MQRELTASIGYLELGMIAEADGELESLPPENRSDSSVLALRVEIYRSAKKWTLMEAVVRELLKRHPYELVHWINLAWAVRRSDSIEAAQIILLEALEKFPNDSTIRYNLGCYACQLGDLEEAKRLVGEAIKIDSKYKLLAIDDEDLKPLWDSFKA
jgi:predicted Zn-dependent protease